MRAMMLVILVILANLTYSQKINISGKVVNTKNESIPGASILVEATKKIIMANVDGAFTLSLDKGVKYSITVSSTGYNSKTIDDVEATGADDALIVVLSPKVTTGENIVIRSTRRQESSVALLTFQRIKTSLASGLAADFIRRTPEKNTGEVL